MMKFLITFPLVKKLIQMKKKVIQLKNLKNKVIPFPSLNMRHFLHKWKKNGKMKKCKL